MHAKDREELKKCAQATSLLLLAKRGHNRRYAVRPQYVITLAHEIPEPVISIAVEPRSADQDKMGVALGKLAAEDLLFVFIPMKNRDKPLFLVWASYLDIIVSNDGNLKLSVMLVSLRWLIAKPFASGRS